MNITRNDLSKEISKNLSMTHSESKLFLKSFINKIISFSEKGKVKISGFGSFYYKDSPERIGRNPKTKETYKIVKRSKFTLKVSNIAREILNWEFIQKLNYLHFL